MIQPVSPIFHGRHIFAPAAAHLASGVLIEEFGAELEFNKLVPAPYPEAEIQDGKINAEVININKFGSLNLNILHATWDKLGLLQKQTVQVQFKGQSLNLPFIETFGQVEKDQPLILKDDYGRVEIAINLGSFAQKYNIEVGDTFQIKKSSFAQNV